MSLPGGHERCTLQQVLNAQDWSELCGHVQKRGHGDVLSTTRARDACTLLSRGLLSRPQNLEQCKRLGGLALSYLFDSPVVSTFEWSDNVAITHT